MGLNVGFILLDQLGRILDDQQVLGILLFRRFGEVEGARDDRGRVDHHDLVMGNGVLVIDERLDAGVEKKGGRAVFLRLIGLVEHGEHVDATFVSVDQRFGDGC